MRTPRIRKLSAVIVATIGLLVVNGGPVAATPFVGSVSGGPLGIDTVNPVEHYDWMVDGSLPAGAPCPADPTPPELTLDFDGSGGTTVTGVSLPRTQFVFWSTWFYVEYSLGGTGSRVGSISGSSFFQSLPLQAVIRPINAGCALGSVICTLRTTLSLSGTWSGGLTPPGTAILAGGPANIIRGGPCTAPFATRFPATAPLAQATLSNLTIAF